MLNYGEKKLLLAIKYVPLIFIIFLSVLVTSVLEFSNKKFIEESIKETTELYIKLHNDDIKEEVEKVYNYIKNEQLNSLNELKKNIKNRVYEAHSIATKIYEDNKDTKTDKEILELIKTALGSIIYNNGRGYFFIDSVDGIGILQPLNRQLEGVNKLEFTDAKGYQFVKTIVETIKNKSERYDSYYWYKGGDKINSYPKMSFYKYFEPLNFAIGTGDYIDDFLKELKDKILKNIKEIKLKKDGYIFIVNSKGDVLSHINEDIDGKNQNDFESSNLKPMKKIVELVKQSDSGFIQYDYQSPNNGIYKKTSYIKNFKEWDWIIGTGYHDKDLNKIIEKETKRLKQKYQEEYGLILIISIVSTIILLILSIFVSKLLEKRFVLYRNRIKMEEMEFKNLFEKSEVGLAITKINGEFIKVNKKFLKMLGYSNESELLNKSWNAITQNRFTKEEIKIFKDLRDKKIDRFNLEKSYIKKDGTFFDGYINANVFSIDGQTKYVLCSLIDITEVKAKDNLLFQQSKMASMGEMIANIAHQWRQPLSTISTAASGIRLQKELGCLDENDLINSLDVINDTSQYLSNTIDDFREFFNPNNKEKINVDSEELINHALKLISGQFKNKNIHIHKDIEKIEFKVLKNELIQVLLNILNNSRDALELKENEKLIFIKFVKKDSFIEISIKDNAGGINKDIISRIFEPYFTTKHKAQGTGIGLYMVEEITKKHLNGKIEVENVEYIYENKKQKGALFSVILPTK